MRPTALVVASVLAALAAGTEAYAQGAPPAPSAPPAAPPPSAALPPPPPGQPPATYPPPAYGPPGPPMPGAPQQPRLGTYGHPGQPGMPYYLYVPTTMGPTKLSWEEGEPIPPGYHLEGSINKGMFIAGLSIFGGAYLASAFVAGTVEDDEFLTLFIPIAGPFVTMGTVGSEGAGTFWLAVDGAVQSTGIVLAIVGLATGSDYLIRNDVAREGWTPDVALGPTGGEITWSF